jgi:hypothetical protein
LAFPVEQIMKSKIQKAQRFLLVACLLAIALPPPSIIVHTHRDGQSRHDHVTVHERGWDAMSQTPSRPDDFDHHGIAFEGDDVHEHLYVPFLGTTQSLPPSSGRTRPERESSTIIGIPAANPTVTSFASVSTRLAIQMWCLVKPPGEPILDCALSERQRSWHEPRLPVLLCDSARHERSGVQLI